MKNIIYGFIAISCILAACGNNSSNKTGSSTDSSGNSIIVPPPDNSSATNPSLADSAFKNPKTDSSKTGKDSIK